MSPVVVKHECQLPRGTLVHFLPVRCFFGHAFSTKGLFVFDEVRV